MANHSPALADPNGRYAARVVTGDFLQVFLANAPSVLVISVPVIEGAGCKQIWSWSEDGRRLLCRTATNRVAVYELPEPGPTIAQVTPRPVMGDYEHDDAAALYHRRVVSPSGRYLAFTTEDALMVADLAPTSTQLIYFEGLPVTPGDPEPPRVDLAFSPDERVIFAHVNNRFRVYLPFDRRIGNEGSLLGLASECFEDSLRSPRDWCGRVQKPRTFALFSGNDISHVQVAAAKTQAGTLKVFTCRPESKVFVSSSTVDDACENDCIGQFGFQP